MVNSLCSFMNGIFVVTVRRTGCLFRDLSTESGLTNPESGRRLGAFLLALLADIECLLKQRVYVIVRKPAGTRIVTSQNDELNRVRIAVMLILRSRPLQLLSSHDLGVKAAILSASFTWYPTLA